MAIHFCFAVYYIFNISYPPGTAPLMLCFEYIYQKPVPLCVTAVIDSIEKMLQQT